MSNEVIISFVSREKENDGVEEKRGCSMLDGWCVERMQDKARDIITKRLKDMLKSLTDEEGSSKESSTDIIPTKTESLAEEEGDDDDEEDEEEEYGEQSEENLTLDDEFE